jgi:hypothetical protein
MTCDGNANWSVVVMRIKADLYSGRLFEHWEPKKHDHQTLPVISHCNIKDKHRDRSKRETQSYNDDERRHRDQNEKYKRKVLSGKFRTRSA